MIRIPLRAFYAMVCLFGHSELYTSRDREGAGDCFVTRSLTVAARIIFLVR